MDYKIRDYVDKDYEEVMNLWIEVGLNRPERGDTPEIIQATISNGGRLVLLTDIKKNTIIGTSWLSTDYRRIFLTHFCVKTEYQGKGLAHKLLEESFNFAKKMNLQVKLEVRRSNCKAIKLYQNYGFSYLGDFDIYVARDIHNTPYDKTSE